MQSSANFPLSKLRPPQLRVPFIERPRLQAKLEQGQSRRLTFVHAPAGFGKTTLLVQWFAHLRAARKAIAWFTFDEDDSDPAPFLAYVAESFTNLAPTPAPPAGGRQTHPRVWLRALTQTLNKIATLRDVVLVLDDCHLIKARSLRKLVDRLVQSAPDNLHIVIASRSRSILQLSSLVLQGQVMILGSDDLRLTPDELQLVLAGAVAPQTARQLFESTQGWPMAVQFALSWARRGDDVQRKSSAEEDIATYLTEEVMDELPETLRQFLIQICVVDEINGDLANALRGMTDGWRMLDSLAPLDILLEPLGGNGGWRRLHPVFASYLRAQTGALGEERLCRLHSAASGWYARHNDLEGAVRHAALAGDDIAAAELIENAGGVWLSIERGLQRLRRLLAHLPADLINRRPRLRAARALLWVKDGKIEAARLEIQHLSAANGVIRASLWNENAEQDSLIVGAAIAGQTDEGVAPEALKVLTDLTHSSVAGAPSWIQAVFNGALCMAYSGQGNVRLAQAAAREAVWIYDEHNALSGRIFGRLHLGSALLAHGNLLEALEVLSSAEALGMELTPADTTTLAMVRILLAHVRYECNDLAGAAELCDLALIEVEHAEGSLDIYHAGYWVASGLRLARGDATDALRTVERGLRMAGHRDLRRLRRLLEYRRLDILSRVDPTALPNFRTQLELFRSQQTDMCFLERETASMTLARLAIRSGEMRVAVDLLEPLLEPCEKYGRGSAMIRLQILLALANRHSDQREQATSAVRHALTMAASERVVRVFLDEGPEVFELLDEALRHIGIGNLETDEVRLLAEIFSSRLEAEGHPAPDLARILKPREREVLGGLRDGLSNKVIARRLGLTDDTIKYHLKKIYAKLGVSDRAMAVAVAQHHGIVV